MKKYIVIAMLLMAVTVFAAEDEPIVGCMKKGALNYNPEATVSAPCQFMGNGDPMAVMQSWGLSGHSTPTVSAGTVVNDGYGISAVCPKWQPAGCFNLTTTNWYKQYMTNLAKQLLGNGFWVQFPQYKEWYRVARGY